MLLSYRQRGPPINAKCDGCDDDDPSPTHEQRDLAWSFAAQATAPPRAASSRRPMARLAATCEPAAAAGRTASEHQQIARATSAAATPRPCRAAAISPAAARFVTDRRTQGSEGWRRPGEITERSEGREGGDAVTVKKGIIIYPPACMHKGGRTTLSSLSRRGRASEQTHGVCTGGPREHCNLQDDEQSVLLAG